jgi:hypothetical protein
MKRILIFLLMMIAGSFIQQLTAQTVYATLTSGSWASTTTWETYSTFANALAGSPGSGTAATTIPSGTHNVLIRTGHTVTMADANRGCKGIIIQAGGKLWNNGGAGDRRLQIGAGGTGFTYPLVDTVQVDGVMGGASDPMFIETGVNAQQVKIFGTGSIDVKRLRTVGNAGAGFGGALTVDIDINMNFWQTANYAFTAIYNPAAGDNYTINIFPGRTVSLKTADGYFNNNSIGSGTGFGTYTYNINGTLDLSASTQTATNLTAFSPTAGTMNVNVNGTIITGAAFNSSPVSPGVANLTINNGGLVDASLATVMNFNGGMFVTNGTGAVKRNVLGDGTRSSYAVSTSAAGNNTAVISRLNSSGTTASYTVNVQNTFTNPPADASKCVNKQWNIAITGSPSSADTLRLSWLTGDQAGSFSPVGTVSIMHWNGSSWDYTPASVTGTGVAADPYVARASGFTSYSPFGVTSFTPVPLSLLGFNASYDGKKVNASWVTTNEINTKHFDIERSNDGANYTAIGNVVAKNSTGSNNYSFADVLPLSGASFYRLKMVDNDGRFKYSHVISINTKIKAGLTVYPNPAVNVVTVNHGKLNTGATIKIIGTDGSLLVTTKIATDAVQTTIDVSKLAKGTYRVIAGDDTNKNSVVFLKQ